ncbi:phosphoribosyl transferase [Candidatus Kaiserbacteria bacterium RIFCSPLOWO2_02_FULL_56_11]|nr:MAG: phosphoribosyl transferase [Candidatus Kaiserbacteria bacterium RIFCSPLOWO2_02_FULL_56_11]
MHFDNRKDAGVRLAKALARYDNEDAIIYALPRGGVVLGAEVARQLELPLELVIPRKIGHPENPEYAVCAVTEEGDLVCNEEEASRLDPTWLKGAVKREQEETKRRRKAYVGRKRLPATGKLAVIVDDGIATGLTMRAAIRSLRKELPIEIVIAAPIAPHEVVEYLRHEADDVVVLDDSEPFLGAIGAYYTDFPQVTDAEVTKLLSSFS